MILWNRLLLFYEDKPMILNCDFYFAMRSSDGFWHFCIYTYELNHRDDWKINEELVNTNLHTREHTIVGNMLQLWTEYIPINKSFE